MSPCYEYRCEHCDNTREVIVSRVSDAPKEVTCEVCGAEAKKIISRSSFILEGGGWASSGYTKQ